MEIEATGRTFVASGYPVEEDTQALRTDEILEAANAAQSQVDNQD